MLATMLLDMSWDSGMVKKLNVVFYASRSFDEDQKHLATTEKELIDIVFACDKFRSYIINSKVIVHTDHRALR